MSSIPMLSEFFLADGENSGSKPALSIRSASNSGKDGKVEFAEVMGRNRRDAETAQFSTGFEHLFVFRNEKVGLKGLSKRQKLHVVLIATEGVRRIGRKMHAH